MQRTLELALALTDQGLHLLVLGDNKVLNLLREALKVRNEVRGLIVFVDFRELGQVRVAAP